MICQIEPDIARKSWDLQVDSKFKLSDGWSLRDKKRLFHEKKRDVMNLRLAVVGAQRPILRVNERVRAMQGRVARFYPTSTRILNKIRAIPQV
jgi:hypothetical protein